MDVRWTNSPTSYRPTSIRSFRLLTVILIALALLQLLAQAQTRPAQAQTWTLAWSDEFNGSGAPSSANWNYHVGNGRNPGLNAFDGWGNGEWEWYRPENCYQQNGSLVIRADWLTTPMVIDGRNWYQRSCRITSDGHRSFRYGRIEARIAMPNATGSWPAFWMMGDACDDTSTNSYNPAQSYWDTMATNWASCGEVDIMEHKNSDTTIVNNIFWDIRTGLYPWTAGQNANYVTTANAGNVTTFHTYEIRWDASYIRWYLDGVQTHVIDIRPGTLEEFHRNFHIILNLALGGAFPAQNPVQSQFPLYMYVDYVRYYTAGGTTVPTATRTNTTGTGPTATRTRTATSCATCATATRTRTATTSAGTTTWAPNRWYAVGTTVTYNGVTYRCLQAHTSQTGWEPPNVPALWQRL